MNSSILRLAAERVLRRFPDQRGNVAIAFSVTALPAIISAAGIDYSRLVDFRARHRTRSMRRCCDWRSKILDATEAARTLAASTNLTVVSTSFTTKSNAAGQTVYVGDATVALR
ncbi:MAG: hypothetical protein U1E19_10705 [Rhodoblastus sp.]